MRNAGREGIKLGILQASETGIGPLQECAATAERLLLREFFHRTNNELASAISLISVAAHRCGSNEARAVLATVQGRLENYASVQHSLQRPEYSTAIELSGYIEQLCRAISRSKLEREGIELSLSLHPFRMKSDRCWLLGMIVFELTTNSARHAFRNRAGLIHVSVYPTDTSIACSVTDNGSSEPSASAGRGLAIVEALAASMHGTVDVQFGREGTTTVVSFPYQA